MSAYVVVRLASARRAKRARGKQATLDDDGKRAALTHDKVKRLLTEHGAEVILSAEPQSAGDESPQSATIHVADMACANRLAAALRGMDGIETAYAKPGEELP